MELEGTIVHPFIFRQFLHNTASRRIIQDGRSKKFHFDQLGHLEFVETVVYTRNVSGIKANDDYIGLLRVNFEAYPLELSDAPLHIAEDRFRGATDRRFIEIPDIQFGLYSTGDMICCECKQVMADRVSLLDA